MKNCSREVRHTARLGLRLNAVVFIFLSLHTHTHTPAVPRPPLRSAPSPVPSQVLPAALLWQVPALRASNGLPYPSHAALVSDLVAGPVGTADALARSLSTSVVLLPGLTGGAAGLAATVRLGKLQTVQPGDTSLGVALSAVVVAGASAVAGVVCGACARCPRPSWGLSGTVPKWALLLRGSLG
jgi:hypothetical protein